MTYWFHLLKRSERALPALLDKPSEWRGVMRGNHPCQYIHSITRRWDGKVVQIRRYVPATTPAQIGTFVTGGHRTPGPLVGRVLEGKLMVGFYCTCREPRCKKKGQLGAGEISAGKLFVTGVDAHIWAFVDQPALVMTVSRPPRAKFLRRWEDPLPELPAGRVQHLLEMARRHYPAV